MSTIKKYEKNWKNPFIDKAIDEINGHIIRKYKTAGKTDQRAILQAIDPKTGEFLGHTSFIRQIEVDEEKFTKVYLSQFSAFWDLNKEAIKVFGYIMTKLIPKQDMFSFFIQECMEYTGYKSDRSIRKGLSSLLASEIIARGPSDHHYFINPLVAFNGDRVTYARTYIKKKKESDPNQLKIFNEESAESFENESK